MASPVVASMLPRGLVGLGKVEAFNTAARSRSTSAGRSSQSDGQISFDSQQKVVSPPLSPPVYSAAALGLPEYDYPTPWSIQGVPQLPEVDYPAPFVMNNTFMGFDIGRPQSLDEYFTERQTKSCPASGLALPPGLEDLVQPEQAAANLLAAEAVLRREMEDTCMEKATYHLPDGLFEAQTDFAVPEDFWPTEPRQRSAWDFDSRHQASSFSPTTWQAAQPLPLLLESLVGLQAAPQAQQAQAFHMAQAEQPELGSAECPTLGSHDHKFGTCKPCAFLYTKGCGNGVLCPFCHLCDAGEKKRRSKDKRAAIKQARQCQPHWNC